MSTFELVPLKPNIYDLQRETAKIMGWQYKHVFGKFVVNKPGEPMTMVHEWNPCKELTDALEIVKKFTMKMHFNGEQWVVYTDYTTHGLIEAKDAELPMAICLAILEHQAAGRR